MKGLIKYIKVSFDFKKFDKINPKPLLDFKDFDVDFSGDDWTFDVFEESDLKVKLSASVLSLGFIKKRTSNWI